MLSITYHYLILRVVLCIVLSIYAKGYKMLDPGPHIIEQPKTGGV